MIDFQNVLFYIVFLVLPGSVETQLRWSGKHLRVTLFIPVSTGSKGVKIDQETPEL